MHRSTGVSYAPRPLVGATGKPRMGEYDRLGEVQAQPTNWLKVGLTALAVGAFIWWVIPRDAE